MAKLTHLEDATTYSFCRVQPVQNDHGPLGVAVLPHLHSHHLSYSTFDFVFLMKILRVLVVYSIYSIYFADAVKNGAKNGTDPNGYIVFCPCMGRFGNQIDQFLGVLSFAKSLDRTLVLPNFIEFNHPETKMIPFEVLFQVGTVAKYTRVVTMHEFTKKIIKAFCWNPRKAIYDTDAEPGCHAKEGNPFGPYWDQIGVSFVGDEYFGEIPGGFETSQMGSRKKWLEKFGPEEFPVLAFPSAPAAFPSKGKVWSIQKYLRWSSRITEQAKKYITNNLQKPFVAVHLRNDADWVRVCDHIDLEKNRPLFASEQCLGEGHHQGQLTMEMCIPNKQQIVDMIVEKVGSIGAKSVFVASDKDHMIDEINEALKPYEIEAHRQEVDDMYTSLAIMGRSDLFIGNCVSTFSHIVKRERDHTGQSPRPSAFFGVRSARRHIDL
nr:protein-O-fucosyltransferase 1 [Caenorhabditis briggsae]